MRILLREDRGKQLSCIHQLQPVCFDNDERQTRQTRLPENTGQTHFSRQNAKEKISKHCNTLLITSSLSQSVDALKNGARYSFYPPSIGIETRQAKYQENFHCGIIHLFRAGGPITQSCKMKVLKIHPQFLTHSCLGFCNHVNCRNVQPILLSNLTSLQCVFLPQLHKPSTSNITTTSSLVPDLARIPKNNQSPPCFSGSSHLDTEDMYSSTAAVIMKTVLQSTSDSYSQPAHTGYAFNTRRATSVHCKDLLQKTIGSLLSPVPLKGSSSCCLGEFFLAAIASGLFIKVFISCDRTVGHFVGRINSH